MIGDGLPDLVALVKEYQPTFNERDVDAWAELCAPEIEIDALTLRGIDAAQGFAQQTAQNFPDIAAETVRVVARSDTAGVYETRPVNRSAASADQNAWCLGVETCVSFEFREDRMVRLRHYFAPAPTYRAEE